MTAARWYARPEGEGLTLRKVPRLASWNKATDPDQVRLREYLEDTAELLAPAMVSGPWALRLDVGLTTGRDLIDMADLDNYAFPLATHLRSEDLVSVWCTKRHADTSRVLVAPARETPAPEATYTVRTTASSQAKAYKEQVPGAGSRRRRRAWTRLGLRLSEICPQPRDGPKGQRLTAMRQN